MDAERRSNDCPRCRELERRVAELEALVRSLSDQDAKLSAALEEERRRGQRQAAPFRKQDEPTAEPKKSGKRHGPHAHRSVPPRIDETYDVPLPQTCPSCGDRHVSETQVATQYQTEIPTTTAKAAERSS